MRFCVAARSSSIDFWNAACAALDGRRGGDQLLGQGVRDRRRVAPGTASWAAMVQQRAVTSGASTCTRFASDPRVSSRAPRSLITLSRIGRVFATVAYVADEVLGDEELACSQGSRPRAPGPRSAWPSPRRPSAARLLTTKRGGAGQHGRHQHQRQARPETWRSGGGGPRGVTLSCPARGGFNVSASSASRSIGHDIRDRRPVPIGRSS